MTAPPTIAVAITPDPSAARCPSPSLASVKMVGNMIEFISPIASSDQADTAPLLFADSRINAIAPVATAASTLPGDTRASTAAPTNRPISAPPQYRGTCFPAATSLSASVPGCIR